MVALVYEWNNGNMQNGINDKVNVSDDGILMTGCNSIKWDKPHSRGSNETKRLPNLDASGWFGLLSPLKRQV